MIVKSALIVLLVMFLGFVAWMNLTPGHFERIECPEGFTNNPKILYVTAKEQERLNSRPCLALGVYIPESIPETIVGIGMGLIRFVGRPILLVSANLDFNK